MLEKNVCNEKDVTTPDRSWKALEPSEAKLAKFDIQKPSGHFPPEFLDQNNTNRNVKDNCNMVTNNRNQSQKLPRNPYLKKPKRSFKEMEYGSSFGPSVDTLKQGRDHASLHTSNERKFNFESMTKPMNKTHNTNTFVVNKIHNPYEKNRKQTPIMSKLVQESKEQSHNTNKNQLSLQSRPGTFENPAFKINQTKSTITTLDQGKYNSTEQVGKQKGFENFDGGIDWEAAVNYIESKNLNKHDVSTASDENTTHQSRDPPKNGKDISCTSTIKYRSNESEKMKSNGQIQEIKLNSATNYELVNSTRKLVAKQKYIQYRYHQEKHHIENEGTCSKSLEDQNANDSNAEIRSKNCHANSNAKYEDQINFDNDDEFDNGIDWRSIDINFGSYGKAKNSNELRQNCTKGLYNSPSSKFTKKDVKEDNRNLEGPYQHEGNIQVINVQNDWGSIDEPHIDFYNDNCSPLMCNLNQSHDEKNPSNGSYTPTDMLKMHNHKTQDKQNSSILREPEPVASSAHCQGEEKKIESHLDTSLHKSPMTNTVMKPKKQNIMDSNNLCTLNQNLDKKEHTNQVLFSKPQKLSKKSAELPPLPAEIDYDRKRILPIQDGYLPSLIKNANISKPLLNGWKLHPWQKMAVIKGLKLRHVVLAYDMGLGKTLIACVWANAFKKTFDSVKIYIIAPVSLREEWRKTAFQATGMESVPEKLPKHHVDDKNLDIVITTWGKVPKEVPPHVHNFVVICDEAHQMQSMTSARTKDVLNLTSEQRCIGCLLVTGTPMKNGKPLNLFPLLKAVRHPFGDEQKIYEIMFCAGKEKRYGPGKRVWDANGSSNLSILNAHISSHVLYMTKDDCLKNLPPKTRLRHKVAVSRHYEIMYTNRINDLAKAKKVCEDLDNRDMGEAMLGLLQKVRFAASIAKVDAAVALAMTILEKEPAIVIFTSFVDVAKGVHQKLSDSGWSGEILTGETPSSKRAHAVQKFQDGVSPVFVGTFGAGGVGLTLTAACTIILVDRPWTPGEAMQAEDRVRRIGQTKKVTSIWMTAFEVDEQIDGMIEQKKMNSNAVIEGNTGHQNFCVGGKVAPKLSIMQLVDKVIPIGKDLSFQGLHRDFGLVTSNDNTKKESNVRTQVDAEGGFTISDNEHNL